VPEPVLGIAERRQWDRLKLAIPMFIRGTDQHGKRFIELATALNISAGGALIAVRRYLQPDSAISLDIPSSPLLQAAALPEAVHTMEGRLLRVTMADRHCLAGVEFARPLS
jgi:hypothetical protein